MLYTRCTSNCRVIWPIKMIRLGPRATEISDGDARKFTTGGGATMSTHCSRISKNGGGHHSGHRKDEARFTSNLKDYT